MLAQVLIELHAETIPGFRDQGALPKTWGTDRASSLFAFFNGELRLAKSRHPESRSLAVVDKSSAASNGFCVLFIYMSW